MEHIEAVATYFTEDRTFVTSDSALIDFDPWGGKTSCGPPILMMQTS